MKKDFKTYWTLFTSTFFKRFYFWGRICNCPINEEKFVDELHWIEDREMLDLTAISRSSPGAIAVNASILIGYRIAGFLEL